MDLGIVVYLVFGFLIIGLIYNLILLVVRLFQYRTYVKQNREKINYDPEKDAKGIKWWMWIFVFLFGFAFFLWVKNRENKNEQ